MPALWSSQTRWRVTVIVLALAALVVRLALIAHSGGGTDLRIYTYFSELPKHGLNPFNAPAGGPFPPQQSDQPPVEVALFAGLLALHDSPNTLRVLFALADTGVVLLLGLWFPRSHPWRLGMMLFYAFNPFVLLSFTAFAEDKTLLFLGIVVWVGALERDRQWLAWGAAAGLTVFKYLGAFAVPALALHSWRTRGSWVRWPLAAFALAFVVSNAPWFPHSLDAFSRRDTRLAIDPPIHASPTLVLSKLGIYAPVEAKLLTAAAIVLVLALFVRRTLTIVEAVIWSLFAGYIFLPDDPFGRLLLITLPFMLLLDFTLTRWIALWVLTCVLALGGAVATSGVPGALSSLAGTLFDVFGREATLRHVIWMNLLPALVLGFYFADRRAGRLILPASAPPSRARPDRESRTPALRGGG